MYLLETDLDLKEVYQPTSSKKSRSSSEKPGDFAEFIEKLHCASNVQTPSCTDLQIEMTRYEKNDRIPIDGNVLEFWASSNSKLAAIAMVVLAIPSTQVTVERLFSSLKYIFSEQRNRLSPLVLESILLIRANGIFEH